MSLSLRPADLDGVLEAALGKGRVTVVVACGQDPAALAAVQMAEECGLARAILVGDPRLIEPAMAALPAPLKEARIEAVEEEEAAVRRAVELVREGRGDVLLKGKTQTGTVMRAVLDRDCGLRTGRLLSDAFLFEYPAGGTTRLVCITDGGINVAPDLAAKKHILENAVQVYHALGHERPRVAVMSAVETVIPDHAPSQDAVALAQMARDGEITGCAVEGPLSLDLSISPEAAGKKGAGGEVAGRADIMVCPEIVSANLLAKGTTYFAGYRLAHVIMGASRPVLIPSRSDKPLAKMHSIALGALIAQK